MSSIARFGHWRVGLLPLLVAVACSDGSDTPNAPAGAGGSAGAGASGGTSGADGSGPSPDGGDASTASDGAATGQGVFTAQAYLPALSPAGAGGLSARFSATISVPLGPGCTRRTVASCVVDECPISNGGATDGGTPLKSPHAGALTFTGTGVDVKISIEPDSLGQYPLGNPPGTGSQFLGGEPAKIVATGGDVPAFEIDSKYPLLLTLDKPTTMTGQAAVPRTQDLSLAWSRGAPDVVFYLQGSSATAMFTKSVNIWCQVVSSQGSLTIPTAELSRFNAGTKFTLASFNRATARAGAYQVDFYVGGEVITPDKRSAVELTLQ